MIWFYFSLLTSLFESLKDVSSKKGLKNVNEYIVSWSLRFFSSLFLLPLLLFVDIPFLGKPFFIALLSEGVIDSITTVLYMKAIKYSDLSLSVPMVTFTPLFLLITSPIMIGEFPAILGFFGTFFIVVGSYILNIKEKRRSYLSPFKVLFKEKGPRLMLMVAFIWSITSNIDKIGVKNSSPIFWAFSINILTAIFIFPIILLKLRENMKQFMAHINSIIPIGFFGALTIIFQMLAINLALVTYVISIKRTSAILSVIFGHLIFKEGGIKERLIGVLTMVIGVFFIALS